MLSLNHSHRTKWSGSCFQIMFSSGRRLVPVWQVLRIALWKYSEFSSYFSYNSMFIQLLPLSVSLPAFMCWTSHWPLASQQHVCLIHTGYGGGMISKEEILVLRRENYEVICVKFLWYFSMYQITVTKCVIHLVRHCYPVSVCRVIVLEALIL